jgi:RNA ligase (TIGR02306 family)
MNENQNELDRKLATVVRVESLEPIPGADAIELARVKGWQVVVKKGEFKVNDLGVYFEIDSFLPIRPEFEFLRKNCLREMDGKQGFRLKTIKLRGQISQGLLLPLSTFYKEHRPNEGEDVTEAMGVIKYEAKLPGCNLGGDCKGNFPSWITKTDEERIQNLYAKNRTKIRSTIFYTTEKLEGSSFTAYSVRYAVPGSEDCFGVCSRNMELQESQGNAFWQAANSLGLREKLFRYLQNHGEVFNIAIQGELVGPGVQGNIYKLPERTVYFFGVIVNGRKLDYWAFREAMVELDLLVVPLVDVPVTLVQTQIRYGIDKTVEDILKMAEGPSYLNPSQEREGIVFRALDGSIGFKAISNRYLLGDKS